MKIKQDFITNSSSSSFIIIAGKVQDEAKCIEWCTRLGFNANEYKIVNLKDDKANRFIEYKYNEKTKTLDIDSFMGYGVLIKDCEPTDKIFIYDYDGDEGDGCFMNDSEDIDYDIDLNFFDTNQIDLYNQANKVEISGLTDVDSTYGAGRNG